MRRYVGLVLAAAAVVLLAIVPYLDVDTHGVFSSELSSPGSLQLLGLCLVFGAVALTYDLLFGFTGLLSFGHALYFAVGVYLTAIATTRWEWSLGKTLALVAVVGVVLPFVLGFVSLRVGGIAFAMVTLAFAEAGSILVDKNPKGWTGGEEGTPVAFEALPEAFVGVLNTKNLYWLALGYLVVVVADRATGPSTPRPAASGRRSARTSRVSRCWGCIPSASSSPRSSSRPSSPRPAGSSTSSSSAARPRR